MKVTGMTKSVARVLVLAALLLLLGASRRRAPKSAWNNAKYTGFTPETFKKYPPANERIDFGKCDYALLDAAIFFETNHARIRQGKRPLAYSWGLRKAAAGHCRQMIARNFFSHKNPYSSANRTPSLRIRRAGVRSGRFAENLGVLVGNEEMTYLSCAQSFVEGWMNSPGHQKNLLHDEAIALGAAARAYVSNVKEVKKHGAPKAYNLKACQNFSLRPGSRTRRLPGLR